ncbi:hypothetical protein [Streptosporangium roseum]|uniref:Glycosyltransferase RgtA/B/C/D-like domain-containing protein n=1 Tax=Streptosporangium roseum (strain ATCC 12428 / DSM 43021 / JCM 3005 / KCTC 9067 / NCIMB 10171 / NRRL 2505 / NI 9100) TaxID=479432 RepID=D2B1Z4_STRRD|nr:hypothetical protein [Streptosporangium roseum]ACZ89218.1 hypothetical protein Sros_6504 [Streptosporangium roseum DSM 43021]
MEYLVVVAAVVVLVFLVHANLERGVARRALPVLLAAFAVRMAVHVLVMRSGVIEYGGDNLGYEIRAMQIVEYWKSNGFQFVTSEDISTLSFVAVPCQVFAIIVYLCGGPAPLACTAVVALLACALCIVMYKFARLVGADDRASFLLLVVTAFMPAFLLHTSDTYKDGFNAFLVVTSIGLGTSIARRFDMRRLLMLVPLLWALWYVRPYMVFMCAVPLILGLMGLKKVFSLRGLFVSTVLLVSALLVFGGVYESTPVEVIQQQLEMGQAENVRSANGDGGSGVVFEDGGNPWSTLDAKLLYTVLSPFPWTQGGQMLQLGKIDVLIWYFLLYHAVRGARRLWCHDRVALLVLLSFVIPGTIVYATTMANMGLIFRQRIPIVMVTSVFAAVAWTKNPGDREQPVAEVVSRV